MRNLIVNADDCNLTAGVTRAILNCHTQGIVSSTSWLINLPHDPETAGEAALSGIGIGLHLNVTLGTPVSKPHKIPSLVTKDGVFKKRADYLSAPPDEAELALEYGKQAELFLKRFGRLPTHFDTHHQLHDEPVFMRVLAQIARKYERPIRRSSLMQTPSFQRDYPGLVTTQALLGNLNAHAFWTAESLEKALARVLPGVTEVMCHPGIWDSDLQKLTSMTVAREKEYELFASPHLKNVLEKHSIRLINFSELL